MLCYPTSSTSTTSSTTTTTSTSPDDDDDDLHPTSFTLRCMETELRKLAAWNNLRPSTTSELGLDALLGDWDQSVCGLDTRTLERAYGGQPANVRVESFLDACKDNAGVDEIVTSMCRSTTSTAAASTATTTKTTSRPPAAASLAIRKDLDFVELVWMFLQTAYNRDDVLDALHAIIEELETGRLVPHVGRQGSVGATSSSSSSAAATSSQHGSSGFASAVKDLVRAHTLNTSLEKEELRSDVMRRFDYFLEEPWEWVVEMGVAKMRRDYLVYLLGESLARLASLFVSISTSPNNTPNNTHRRIRHVQPPRSAPRHDSVALDADYVTAHAAPGRRARRLAQAACARGSARRAARSCRCGCSPFCFTARRRVFAARCRHQQQQQVHAHRPRRQPPARLRDHHEARAEFDQEVRRVSYV
jgi:hypothetical protein